MSHSNYAHISKGLRPTAQVETYLKRLAKTFPILVSKLSTDPSKTEAKNRLMANKNNTRYSETRGHEVRRIKYAANY